MIKKLFIVACGALALASCAEKESKIVTDSGLEIDVINGGTDEIDPGMTLLVDFVVKTTDDSVLMSTVSEGLPRPARKVDSIWRGNAGGIEEVIFNLKNKDSVCFNISADKLYGHVTPPGIEKETMLKVNMAVREAMTNEDFQSYRMQKIQEMEAEQLNMDVDIIDAYLEENGISAQKTDSGLHYIITEEGEGANVQVGDVITANYSGYVLNGPYFDSSIEEVAKSGGGSERNSFNSADLNESIVNQGSIANAILTNTPKTSS